MRVLFIRHGKTAGNLEGRYVGRTDEPLCPEGRAALARGGTIAADAVFVSPMRRCRESAAILLPGLEPEVVPGLEECDFGAFEMKNYAELNGNADYQAWIDSGGTLAFPDGESPDAFRARCCQAFAPVARRLLASRAIERAAFVVHGGTIMALLARYGEPRRGYFDWQVKNGEGYQAELAATDDGFALREIRKLD